MNKGWSSVIFDWVTQTALQTIVSLGIPQFGAIVSYEHIGSKRTPVTVTWLGQQQNKRVALSPECGTRYYAM